MSPFKKKVIGLERIGPVCILKSITTQLPNLFEKEADSAKVIADAFLEALFAHNQDIKLMEFFLSAAGPT